jgi:transcriptional regulator with XRE-family HTH domain
MMAITRLRLARLQRGWTLDDLFLRSEGRLSPARVSRIERGLSNASAAESRLLVTLLGVTEQTVTDSGMTLRFAAGESRSHTVECVVKE